MRSAESFRILQEADEEAHAILREAKEYADQTMKNFHKFGKNNISVKEMEAERQRLRQKMTKVEKNISIKETKLRNLKTFRSPSGRRRKGSQPEFKGYGEYTA